MNTTPEQPPSTPSSKTEEPSGYIAILIRTPTNDFSATILTPPVRRIFRVALAAEMTDKAIATPTTLGPLFMTRVRDVQEARSIIVRELEALGYLTFGHLGQRVGEAWQCLYGSADVVVCFDDLIEQTGADHSANMQLLIEHTEIANKQE